MAVKKSQSTQMATWDEELAKQAAISAGMEESTASGQFFSTKSGVLSWNDSPIPGNQMAVIILDSILENVFYEGSYNPDTPQGPICFAFGRDDKTLAPHANVFTAGTNQSMACHGCPMNEFGTADVGRGKACRNTRRLALIPAGSFDAQGKFNMVEDPSHYENTAVAFMKLPVTSVKGYAAFVKQLAGGLKRPPHGIVTKVSVVPDVKSQFKVVFEAITKVPNELMAVVMKRNLEAQSMIDFPYSVGEDEDEAPKPKAKSKSVRPPVKRAPRKY